VPAPIRTRKTTGIYGAPPGLEAQIGGLPYYRQKTGIGDSTEVVSVWTFTPEERDYIARGANLVLGIVGMEPIPPVSLSLRDGEWFEAIPPDEKA
jgi:hypothetical protein